MADASPASSLGPAAPGPPPAARPRRRLRWGDVLSWALLVVALGLVWKRFGPARLDDLGPAPPLAVRTLVGAGEGAPFDLSAHRGEVVVVNAWATWCAPCRAEFPGLVRVAEETARQGVRIVAVALDDARPAAVSAFTAVRMPLESPLVVGLDPGGASMAAWPGGVGVVPTTFVVDRRGRVVMRHEGVLLAPVLRAMLKKVR